MMMMYLQKFSGANYSMLNNDRVNLSLCVGGEKMKKETEQTKRRRRMLREERKRQRKEK